MALATYVFQLHVLVHCNKGDIIFVDGFCDLHAVSRVSGWFYFQFGNVLSLLCLNFMEGFIIIACMLVQIVRLRQSNPILEPQP